MSTVEEQTPAPEVTSQVKSEIKPEVAKSEIASVAPSKTSQLSKAPSILSQTLQQKLELNRIKTAIRKLMNSVD